MVGWGGETVESSVFTIRRGEQGQYSGIEAKVQLFFFHMKLKMSQEPQRLSERDAKNNPASVDGDEGMGQLRHARLCRQMRLKWPD